MGLFPLKAPVDVIIAVWPWGAYLGDEGIKHGIRAKVSSIQCARPHLAGPRRQGHRPVPQQHPRQGRGRSTPATTRRSCSTEHGHVAEGSGENIFVVRDGVLMTPPPSDGVLEGITRDTVMQIAASRGHRRLQERTLTRSDLVHRRRALLHRHGGRDRADPRGRRPRHRRARPDHAPHPGALPRHRRAVATRSSAHYMEYVTSEARGGPMSEPDGTALRHDPARRHAAGGHVGLGRREGAHRAQARRARHPLHRGRLPGLQPQGDRVLPRAWSASGSCNAELVAFGMTRRKGVAAEDDASLRVLAEAFAATVAIVGKTWGLHLEQGPAREPRREPAHDRRLGRASCVAQGKRSSTTPSTSSTATRDDPRLRAALRCTAAAEAGAAVVCLCDTNGATLPPHRRRDVVREVIARRLRAGRHPLPQRQRLRRGQQPRRRRRRRTPGAGHDQRLRRALRQRQPRLDHPGAGAQDGAARA